MQTTSYKLDNGLRVLLVDTEAFPSLTTLLLVGAGSRYENKVNNGVAHFFEHMAFKGSKKYPNAQVLAEIIEGLGGIFNAFTSDDHTGYWVKAPAADAEKIVDVLGDMIQHPNLDPKEIEKEKGVIVQEINMYEDMPQRRVYEIFENLLYNGHPLGFDIIGSKETVTAFTQDTFKNYIDDWYHPNNTVLILAGGLSSSNGKTLDDYKKIIENRFADWKMKDIPAFTPVKESQKEPALKLQYKKSEQAHFIFGYRTFPQSDNRRYALTMLSTILGTGMSSRLFREVREKRGLCYSVRTYPEYYQDVGYVGTYVGVDPIEEKLTEALKVVMHEHQKLIDEPVTKEEMARAIELIKGRVLLSLEDTYNVASMYGQKMLFENEVMSVEDYLKKIEAVTVEDIQNLAAEIFIPETRNFALIGPFKDEKVFRDLLV